MIPLRACAAVGGVSVNKSRFVKSEVRFFVTKHGDAEMVDSWRRLIYQEE